MSQQDHSWRGRALSAGRIVTSAGAAALIAAVLSADAAAQLPAPARPPKTSADALKAMAQPALPAARAIVDRHVAAIAGREAVLSHSSTVAKGKLSMPKAGMEGSLEVYGAKPNKSLLKIMLGGVGEVTEGFDGVRGWSFSPMTGPMLLDGKQLEEKRFDSEFHSELRDKERYVSMTTMEQTDFEGRPCYKVKFVRKSGGEDIEFYDVATGLKAGSITTRETHMGTVTGTTVEADYRKFGNLLQPTTIRSQIGLVEQVITITSVEYDTVPASVFEMPPAIKALVK
jgi:hypothetical protein